ERLDGLLARHHAIDELLLGLDPAVRVAVADLRRRDLIEPGLIGLENGPPQHLDVLGDRGLVGGGSVGTGEAAQQKAGSGESDCTGNGHFTTRDGHRCPPRGWGARPIWRERTLARRHLTRRRAMVGSYSPAAIQSRGMAAGAASQARLTVTLQRLSLPTSTAS